MEKASIIIDLSEDDCIESYLSNDKYKNKIEVYNNRTGFDNLNIIDDKKAMETINRAYYLTQMQKTGTFEHSFRKHLNSVYTFI